MLLFWNFGQTGQIWNRERQNCITWMMTVLCYKSSFLRCANDVSKAKFTLKCIVKTIPNITRLCFYTRTRESTQACSLGRGVLPRPWNHSQPASQMKLNSCWVRLRNSAEILVLGPHLCTRILVRAMIGLLKKPLSICPTRWEGKVDKISSKFILCDHVLNSHDHSVLQSIVITRANLMLITLKA